MCFSVNVNIVKEELESRYGASLIDPDKYRPSYYYHAFAIPEMPVLCSENPTGIEIFKWGLIPSQTRTMDEAESIRLKTFNARSESIHRKKAFSASFRSRRCIVPVKGFFEWQHTGREKIPWYIYNVDNQILSLAGLYDQWIFDRTGEVFNTFTIITTGANDLLAEIHNSTKRMPAILEPDQVQSWLKKNASEKELLDLLKPSKVEILRAHTIGQLVNDRNADRDTPEVIQPHRYHTQGTLF